MGLCNSCESTHVATAKVVIHDGRLQEYPYPVKASYVLLKNPTCFICNSDEMEFDDVVSPLNENEDLLPGNLYFALPLTRLKRPLQPDEMAALAVKASSALMKSGSGGDRCGCRRKVENVYSGEKASNVSGAGNGRRSDSGGGRRKFNTMLNVIPE